MISNKQKIKKTVKQHIPKDWLTDLRICYRICMETVNAIKNTGIVNIFIITTMAIILTIFGVLIRTTISFSSVVEGLGNVLEISVYLKPNVNPQAKSKEIGNFEHVQRVKVITKEKSWNDLKRQIDIPDMENPLPDTLHVKVDKPEYINDVFTKIKTIDGVSDISYSQELAKKMQLINHVVNTTAVIIIVSIAGFTIAIINNTIQLVIQSKKEEIEIMRLMGVNNWYIKTPLVLQGAFYGFTGAFIAIVPLNVVQKMLNNVHQFFMIPAPVFAGALVVSAMFICGTLFGACGSIWSIKKHIQV
ncbi:permease-like cell division protein FtsX [bacterium]|nr:permease-like cell division protein FtsX [bacterium]